MTIIDIKLIRYLNLFEKITRVRTNNCFFYNNVVFFAVPYMLVSKAIGENGKNVKRLAEILGKKIKVIASPKDITEAENFVSAIVAPVTFRSLEVSQEEIIITATKQSKAVLIGRNKTRLEELKKVIGDFFGKRLRIA